MMPIPTLSRFDDTVVGTGICATDQGSKYLVANLTFYNEDSNN